jgi:exopolysaccharide biosynthesis polyprenyl glycosylphosphotransferase
MGAGTRLQEDAWELPATAVAGPFSRSARGRSLRRRLGIREIGTADTTATVAIEEGQPRKQTLVREGLHRRALIAADVIAAALAMTVTWYVAAVHVHPIAFAALPALMLMNKAAGLYDRDELVLHKTTLEDTPALLQISGLLALGVWFGVGQFAAVDLARADVLLLWFGSLSLMLTARVVARAVARRLATTERCVVIGDAASIATVTAKLASSGAKADVVAAIELCSAAPKVDARTFCTLVERHRVDRVIVGPLASDPPADLLEVIRVAKAIGLRVSLIPRLFEVIGSAVAFDELDGLTILGVPRAGLGRSSRFLKRSFDLAGATIGIVLLAPLMAAIAIAIRVDSPGSVLFRQVRVGRDGKRFRILKFRSMVCQAEALKPAVSHLNVAQGVFKIPCDPRLTRVGRWLRRRCLDELPQLFNVWRGEMSLVGPRPLVVDEDAKITGLDRARLALTPGMTGHWQVLGSARIPMQEMVAIDYLYAANWTLWNDVKLLLRTIRLVLSGAGV